MITVKAYFEGKESKILAYFPYISTVEMSGNYVGSVTERAVYSIPLTLYSGVNNPIKITCLNSDQKPIDVSNVTVQMGLFEPNTQNELIVANASPVANQAGAVSVTFNAAQLAPLDFGFYEVAVSAVDQNNNIWPVYIDDNYGSRLTVTLAKGPVFAYADPLNVVFTDVTDVGVVSQQIDLTQRPMGSTVATLCANLVLYTGNIVAQGTMVSIPQPNDWGNVSYTNYSNASGLVFQSVTGSFALIRFVLDSIDPNGWGNLSPANVALYVSGGNIRI